MHLLDTGSNLSRKINLIYRFHKIIGELNLGMQIVLFLTIPLSLSRQAHVDEDSIILSTPSLPRFFHLSLILSHVLKIQNPWWINKT